MAPGKTKKKFSSPFIKNAFEDFLYRVTLGGAMPLLDSDKFHMIQAYYAGYAASAQLHVAMRDQPATMVAEIDEAIKVELEAFSAANREMAASIGSCTVNTGGTLAEQFPERFGGAS